MGFFQSYVENKKDKIPLIRYKRVENYIYDLEKKIKLSEKDKEVVEGIREDINTIIKRIKRLNKIRIGLYLLIYFSFVTYVFSGMEWLYELNFLVAKIVGIVGTPVLIVGLYLINNVVELYYQDINLLTMSIVGVYSKYL